MRGDGYLSERQSWDFRRYIAGDGDDGQKNWTWRYQTGAHTTRISDPHIEVAGVRLLTVVCETCVDVWWTDVPEPETGAIGERHRSHMGRLGRLT